MPGWTSLSKSIAAFGAGACIAATAFAGPYTAMYAFGDSLTDVGNDAIVTGTFVPNPAYYTDGTNTGRFTNGLNYVDHLGSALGVAVAPSVAGGNNYAYGGARVDTIPVPNGKPFDDQIAAYASTHAAADPNALYVVWIGANDMSDAIKGAAFDPANAQTILGSAIGKVLTSTGKALGSLAFLGARHFLVPNLPDLALIPAINGLANPALSGLAHLATVKFNAGLHDLLELPMFGAPLDIRDLDVFNAFNQIVGNPAAFGFANATDSCYTGDVDGTSLPPGNPNPPTVCANPDQYVFWDYEHPTAATGRILAQLAFDAVPEPSGTWALVLAAAALGTWRQRSRRRG